ncbi:MAG: molecular chaperone TorD family protein [Betaproteobacteria bacterium]
MNAQATPQSVRFDAPRRLEPEDQVRADFYALLAALLYRAPDEGLLKAMMLSAEPAGEESDRLATSWAALAAASGVVIAEAVEEEHAALFVGVGRPPVMLFGSYYLSGFMNEKPLAELRNDLRALGFSRDPSVTEPEDHLAALCDVMRALIQGDVADAPASLKQQRDFFAKHMQPWVLQCCGARTQSEKSNYYRRVAAFAQAFFEIEIQAFEM